MTVKRSPAKPSADTKRPIVANPSTPGLQKPNTPTGREAPPPSGDVLTRLAIDDSAQR